MPDYYFISEVPDSIDEPIYDIRTYKKPETFNLLLPSIHASRDNNILDTGADAAQAVSHLQAAALDSPSWPSTEYGDGVINKTNSQNNPSPTDSAPTTSNDSQPPVSRDPWHGGYGAPPPPPAMPKYRPPFWAYDSVRPELLEAARALFYERRRQQTMYAAAGAGHPHQHPPRLPTEYELFAAWASLPRSEKMAYVAEVSGAHPSSPVAIDSLSTHRAVTSLLASCPDSCSWPSFQFSRLQDQQRPQPHPHPRHPHPYQHQRPYQITQPPKFPYSALPFGLD